MYVNTEVKWLVEISLEPTLRHPIFSTGEKFTNGSQMANYLGIIRLALARGAARHGPLRALLLPANAAPSTHRLQLTPERAARAGCRRRRSRAPPFSALPASFCFAAPPPYVAAPGATRRPGASCAS